MRDGPHEHLLQQLGTPAAGEAWKAFLREFTPLIVNVARQYQRDRQGLHDCYLYWIWTPSESLLIKEDLGVTTALGEMTGLITGAKTPLRIEGVREFDSSL